MPQEITIVKPANLVLDAQKSVARTASQSEKEQTNDSSSSDTFTSSSNQIDLAHDGKFTFKQAGKNFVDGILLLKQLLNIRLKQQEQC